MAFSDILRAVQCGFTDAADLIDDVEGRTTPTLYGAANGTTTSLAATVTATTILGMDDTITGIGTDDLIVHIANVALSHDVADETFYIATYADSTAGDTLHNKASESDATGKRDTVTIITIWDSLSGSVDFTTKWSVESTPTGTMYSRRRSQYLLHFKAS